MPDSKWIVLFGWAFLLWCLLVAYGFDPSAIRNARLLTVRYPGLIMGGKSVGPGSIFEILNEDDRIMTIKWPDGLVEHYERAALLASATPSSSLRYGPDG